jgi:anaerobic magnesium-protoporphyrin IX monomethyl ester cyclase
VKPLRVAVIYPPVMKDGKYPLLSQNRHLKFSNSLQVRIFPLVPAQAATSLKAAGHEVLWLDGINERLGMEAFQKALWDFKPDLLMLETKAPVLKTHWEWIRSSKASHTQARFVLVGDHVSIYPQESMENCPADFVLTGGDYDISLTGLAGHLEGRGTMPAGVWYREADGRIVNTGSYELAKNLDELPFIDRELTRWKTYGEAYLLPGAAYILSGRGCGLGHGKVSVCTFCIWQHALWNRTARLRSPANVVAEIKRLVEMGAREIFDDNESGPTYDREWMEEFHRLMKQEGLIGKVPLSTNARGDLLDDGLCELMKNTGFRLLKIGVEAGTDEGLAKIAKLEGIEKIKRGIRAARDHGLVTLLTVMVGYPWETEADVQATYDVTRELMLYKPKFGDCMQASVVIPYPGSPMWLQAKREGWFAIDPQDYDRYDMCAPVLKTQIDHEYWVRKMWRLHLHPYFLLRSALTLRTWDQVNLAWRGVVSLFGHLFDYGKK